MRNKSESGNMLRRTSVVGATIGRPQTVDEKRSRRSKRRGVDAFLDE